MAPGGFAAVLWPFSVLFMFLCRFGRDFLTLTLEESGGIRLATLPQAFAVHHWLRRGRGAIFGARASHAVTFCFSLCCAHLSWCMVEV